MIYYQGGTEMSRKLICLFLSLVMLLSVCLTSCGDKSDDEAVGGIVEDASMDAATLAVYLMSESAVSDETKQEIEKAANKILVSKFNIKTKLKLFYYTPDQYYAKLDAVFAARDAAEKNGTLLNDQKALDELNKGETYIDEYGLVQIKYPEIASYHVDIFYMGGKDMYDKYRSANKLAKLDDEITYSAKDLTTSIAPQLLNNMKTVNGGTYAIPTSKAIDEYTYLLLNKDAMVRSYRSNAGGTTDFSGYTSLTCEKVKDFLEFVSDKNNELTGEYYPLYTNVTEEEMLLTNIKYWGVDERGDLDDAFSVLGGYYNNSDNYLDANKYAKIENLFENDQFISDITTLKQYRLDGYYNVASENQKFAVGYVTGGAEIVDQYGDEYEVIPVSYPRLSEDDLYSDMFGVSSYTSSVSRSMSVLTILNTDTEFRNLMLYGIEGEHYQLIDTDVENQYGETYKVARRLNNNYVMDVNKTGNVFIAYTLEGGSVKSGSYGVTQNLDAKVDLSLGFKPTYNNFKIDAAGLAQIRELSATLWAEYKACDSEDALEAFIASAKARIAESAAVGAHLDYDHGANEDGSEKACSGSCGSLQCSYAAWLKKMKITK